MRQCKPWLLVSRNGGVESHGPREIPIYFLSIFYLFFIYFFPRLSLEDKRPRDWTTTSRKRLIGTIGLYPVHYKYDPITLV